MSKQSLTLTFHGGAGTVTGSNFLLENSDIKILVDCGLTQGELCHNCNRDPFVYDPKSVDVLLVTHAHADHIGRIPRLVREGFKGTIYSTPATHELTEIMYQDSLKILAQEAREKGVLPLYGPRDVKKTLSLWKTVPYHTKTDIDKGFTFSFKDAGHILGSAMIELTYNKPAEVQLPRVGERQVLKIVFTGDLGNSPAPLLRDTEKVTDADYLIMESVYGDKNHEETPERTRKLQTIIEQTIKKGGALMIPAFSIARTQILLYEINNLIEDGNIPSVPVFLDSPLAIAATEIYQKRIQNFKKGVQEEIKEGDDIFQFPKLTFTKTVKESKKINDTPNPKIIIAGSGMSHAGRIQHHERRYLSDPKSTLLLVGYQAAGSLGRRLQDGAKEITIFDTKVPVRASVLNIRGYSAHKDLDNLIDFVSDTKNTVKKVFVAMGEPKASSFLAQRLRDYLGVGAIVPEAGESFELE